MYPQIKEKKEKYIKAGGVHCLNCESTQIEGVEVTVTGGGATQEMRCLKCHSYWTDYYKLDTACGIIIHNDHLIDKEVPDGVVK